MDRPATPSPALLKQSAWYATAAGAVVGLAAPDADAQIVATDLDPDVVLSADEGAGLFSPVDFNGDEVEDIRFVQIDDVTQQSSVPFEFNGWFAADAVVGFANAQNADYRYPSVLEAGASIGPDANFVVNRVEGNESFYGSMFTDFEPYQPGGTFGPWGGQDAYVGVRFQADGNTHYGWVGVEVSADGTTLTIKDYAYEATPDTPIAAGATSVDAEDDGVLAAGHRLSAAYPNPFTGRSTFALEVAAAQPVDVSVYDLLGRRVATLHSGPLAAGQPHTFTVDGAGLPSGVYVVRAEGADFAETMRVTLAR